MLISMKSFLGILSVKSSGGTSRIGLFSQRKDLQVSLANWPIKVALSD